MDLARNLKIDSVSRLATTPPLQVSPDKSVGDAVALMRRDGVGCILVCQAGRLEGIFTERDLMRRVLAEGKPLTTPVGRCMTPRPEVVHPKDSIAAALRHMEEGGYRHLPVVNDAGQPVGVLSVKRIVHYLVEHFPTTVYNLPPDPDAVPQEREGA
jgi:CBS domain-containing protein